VRARATNPTLPEEFFSACIRHGVRIPRDVLVVSVHRQAVDWYRRVVKYGAWKFKKSFIASTSKFGIGQVEGSNRTPLGLHRIAQRIGGRYLQGAIFKGRKFVGYAGEPGVEGAVAHRILWLEGLEPGHNRGGNVDTFNRYIYIHGYMDETTLGRPASHGCVHLAAADLLPLYSELKVGTLVWIER
jgi:lipoprotein-anchoring transpeptidase ErfK/SrfK